MSSSIRAKPQQTSVINPPTRERSSNLNTPVPNTTNNAHIVNPPTRERSSNLNIPVPMTKKPKLKIRMITWNMGDNKNTASGWMENLRELFERTAGETCVSKPFHRECFDILVVALQEDYSTENQYGYGKIGDMILDLLNEDLTGTQNKKWNMTSYETIGSPTEPYTVKLLIYIKTEYVSISINKEKICLKGIDIWNKGVCTKGTVGIALSNKKNKIVFMNSHLQMNRKSKSFGYNARVDGMISSIKNVLSKLDTDRKNLVVLWAGDMNFRKNMSIYDNNESFVVDEQLKHALDSNTAISYKDNKFQEQPILFPETCKLKYCNDKGCPNCRINTDSKFDNTCYVTDEIDEKLNRKPSYCDRILYLVDGEDMKLQPTKYMSFSKSKVIARSDHNLVWADFVLHGFFD